MKRSSNHPFVLLLSLAIPPLLYPLDAWTEEPQPVTSVGSPYRHPAALPEYGSRIGEPARTREDAIFDYYVDRILSEHFQYNPESATNAGIHDFDTLLTQTSAEAIAARLALARNLEAHLRLIREGDLTPVRRVDYEFLGARLRAMQFQHEVERPWARNPTYYVGIVSSGIQSLLHRDFAPLEERVRSLNARLARVPGVFLDARHNLETPPRVYTELAIEQARGLVTFLQGSVVEQVRPVQDAALRGEFDARHKAALEAAREYAAWLESDLLPRSNGDFALGDTEYRQKLLHEEMIETDLDELLDRAATSLQATQAEMEAEARRIDPQLTVAEAFRQIDAAVPAEGKYLEETRKQLAAIREFLKAHPVMTAPSTENLIVAETPPFRRNISFASMSSPGVLERNADEAYYYVTLPDPAWSAERKAEALTSFNPFSLRNTSVHEAYPGHYYQFLALRRCNSTLRSLLGARTNSEGWAHYCEQMLVEEGFGKEDPRFRIAQLRAAAMRLCRLIAGISLHTKGMTVAEAERLFVEKAYMTSVNAAREARRGTVDPIYGVYTLGKWQILDLRQEMSSRLGPGYQLADFHDRFLAQGRAPIPLVRQAMLASLPAPGLRGTP